MSRDLDYDNVRWPVPEFVGLSVGQARALADETGVLLLDAGTSTPLTGQFQGWVARQTPVGAVGQAAGGGDRLAGGSSLVVCGCRAGNRHNHARRAGTVRT